MKCTICGAENLEGAAYCEDCGSKLPTSPPPASGGVEEEFETEETSYGADNDSAGSSEMSGGAIVCPSCGTDNPEGSSFCDDCGSSLESGSVEEEVTEPEIVEEELPETPRGSAKLVVQDSSREFYLDKDVITIGRQSPADGIFPDIDLTEVDVEAYISRRHARILRKDDGFIFEDMGSSNGSFINNVRVTQGVQQFLNEGDMLRLGKTVMTLIKA
jgi:hypothetical protein